MKIKHPGICALCNRYFEDLTFEHIPPRAAFNQHPVKLYSGEKFIGSTNEPWDMRNIRYQNSQLGNGKYTLCKDCNNLTGAWYGRAYQEVAYQFAQTLLCYNANPTITEIEFEVYPLRFIKQVISIICSLSSPDPSTKYPESYPFTTLYQAAKELQELRRFVLDKDKKELDPKKIRIFLYATDSDLGRFDGLTAIGNVNSFEFFPLCEMACYPLGIIAFFFPPEDFTFNGADITYFSNFNYDDKKSIRIPFVVKEINSWIPNDYRTKNEIKDTITESNKFMERRKRDT